MKSMNRLITALVWISLIGAPEIVAAPDDSSNLKGTEWHPLRIGAGGFLTGIDMSLDGSTLVVRADTYGAYIWNQSSSQWTQLVTTHSMPVEDVGVDKNTGVFEIRVAPNLPTRLYMVYRGFIYRSDDRGNRWVKTAFARANVDANDDFRTMGQKLAVDPANPDVVYAGTPVGGVFVTENGGRTWRPLSAIPKGAAAKNGKYPGITGIAFDPKSGSSGLKTKTVFIASYGSGVYRSTNAGVNWTRLNGGPTDVSHAKMSVDGAYYATGNDGSSVWRYDASGWANITPTKDSWGTVVPDPSDAGHIIAVSSGGSLMISYNRGNSWSAKLESLRVATDIPWLAWTNEEYMSAGDMLFDGAHPNRLWFAEGIGVWYTDLPTIPNSTRSVTFNSQSRGIEQLVANQVLAPPGGQPVIASWDRPVFYVTNKDEFPKVHGPDNEYEIIMGWALDYASTRPSFIVGLFNWRGKEKSGFSADSGQTWQPFPNYPPLVSSNKVGGSIAASTPSNFVWVPSNNGSPFKTSDGGVTWTPVSIDGVPTDDETGWGSAYYLKRHIVAADRVTPGTFYLYNYLTGLYHSTDGGDSWIKIHAGEIAPYSRYNAKLDSVPGQSGHLFFTSGQQGDPGAAHPAPNPFKRSIDGGRTWTVVPNVLEVRAFGFGKAAAQYPTIFIVGWVNRIFGIWRSDDDAQSWIKIGNFPLGSLDNVTVIDGDKDVYGTVYIGFSGSGFAYGRLSDAASPNQFLGDRFRARDS
jgi:photosystem II stability/assembly factor-like uncharacterized protein